MQRKKWKELVGIFECFPQLQQRQVRVHIHVRSIVSILISKGCSSNTDCLANEFCNEASCSCELKTCNETRTIFGGNVQTFGKTRYAEAVSEMSLKYKSKFFSIGQSALLKCQENFIYRTDSGAKRSVDLTCVNSHPSPKWVETGKNDLGQCIPGL